jgi:TetR/AcrR family fatty acid metabolism transcriptional regulator
VSADAKPRRSERGASRPPAAVALPVAEAAGKDGTRAVKKRVRKPKLVRRREIAEAAVRIMARHGYYGTSVERIAKAVGISNSALYQHFRNREDVMVAATELLGERADEWIQRASGSSAVERLEKIAETHLEWAAASLESFVRPLFAMVGVTEKARLEPSTPRGVCQAFAALIPIVEQGQREGTIRKDVDPGDLAWAILMFAWAEDMALLARVEAVTEGGVSHRNFRRLFASYLTPEAAARVTAEAAEGVTEP